MLSLRRPLQNRSNEMTTRRRFYAPPPAFITADKIVTLGRDETRHARNVLRLKPGDDVYVFDGEGHEYRCRLAAFQRHAARLDLIETVEPARPESPLNLTLAVALLKGEKFDLVVQKATELGVTRILPVITERADVRWRDSGDGAKRGARWQRIALEAAKQSGRARVPGIAQPIVSKSLMGAATAENAASFAPSNTFRLMFAERDGHSLAEATKHLPGRP